MQTNVKKTDVLCEDPFRIGCKENAVWYRARLHSDKPNWNEFLCDSCLEALKNNGSIPDMRAWIRGEWVE